MEVNVTGYSPSSRARSRLHSLMRARNSVRLFPEVEVNVTGYSPSSRARSRLRSLMRARNSGRLFPEVEVHGAANAAT